MVITWHWFVFFLFFFLGLHFVESQFPGGGVGLATSECKQHKGEILAQYIRRGLVLTKCQTEELFNPLFFDNHERLIEPLEFGTVSVVPVHHHVIVKRNDRLCHISLVYIGTS